MRFDFALKSTLNEIKTVVKTVSDQRRQAERLSHFCTPVSGSEDGKIHVWNAESGMKVALLDGKHTGPITCLQFNPKFMTFASACSNMVSGSSNVGLVEKTTAQRM